MKKEHNIFEPIAVTIAATTEGLREAGRSTERAATPFARAALASIVGGVASLAMTEANVISSMGSPKSPATGKPIKSIRGLTVVEGGSAVREAWRGVLYIAENVDSDQPTLIGEDENSGTVGTGAIRKAVVAFILNEQGAAASLAVLLRNVKAAVTAQADALATARGVQPEAAADEPEAANVTLTERAAAMLVALKAADDAAFIDASEALSLLSDYIDSRWQTLAAATDPEGTDTDGRDGAAEMADAVATLAPLAA